MTSESTLADLTASCRRTTGERPPALVGSSCTLVRGGAHEAARLYVFGGRLVPKRVLVADLYVLNLASLEWRKLWPPPEDAETKVVEFNRQADRVEELNTSSAAGEKQQRQKRRHVRGPAARYFHSADVHGDHIYFFGGMGNQPPAPPPNPPSRPTSPALSISSKTSKGSRASKSSKKSHEQQQQQQQQSPQESEGPFCVLNDLVIYNTATDTWSFPNPSSVSVSGSASASSSLPSSASPTPRYAHLSCISNNCLVILGGQTIASQYIQEINVLDIERNLWIETRRFEGQVGTYRSVLATRPVTLHSGGSSSSSNSSSSKRRSTQSDATRTGNSDSAGLTQLSYSSPADMEPLWLFSNFSFTNVKRSLSMLSAPRAPNFQCPVSHLSHLMSGSVLPPGLRFPIGSVVGHHLIVTGIILSNTPSASSCFSIWALDLSQAPKGGKLAWQKIDPGAILSHGASWNRCVPFHDRNALVILGNRDRDIAGDYEHRQTNYEHVAFIDLEAFGIYTPPLRVLPPLAQDMGLACLAQPGDFEIVCADGKRLACSRAMLEARWDWFASRMEDFRSSSRRAFSKLSTANTTDAQKGHTSQQPSLASNGGASVPDLGGDSAPASAATASFKSKELSDIRLSARSLHLPEPSQVVFAALQYFYSLTLCTPLQHQVNTLVGLLLFSKTYQIPNLRALVCHALHGSLSQGGSVAAVVYEASTLAGANALQIRSLKRMMISSARRHGTRPSASTDAGTKGSRG